MKKLLLVALLFCGTVGGVGSCVSTNNGPAIVNIDAMPDVEYNRWKLYIQLGVKIGANRLLQEKVVTEAELKSAATVIDTLRDQTLIPGASHYIADALQKAGFTNDEAVFLLLVVEGELEARGAFKWVNPVTQVLELSPRTKDLLTTVSGALRSATVVTDEEVQQGKTLQARYNGQLLVQ